MGPRMIVASISLSRSAHRSTPSRERARKQRFESADQKRIMPSLPHLEIAGRLAPAILIDDIGEGNTADWAEPAYGVADRQQGVGMHVGRQPECGLHFLLEVQ